MRTGVFGGSFDPVHNAHLAVAERAVRAAELDKLLFMPVHSQPFKRGAAVSAGTHRMEMLRLAIQGDERFGVTDTELARGGVSYTIDSLRAIRDGGETGDVFFLLGADMLLMLEKWYRSAELLREFSFIAARRPGSDGDDFERCAERLREGYGARVILMDNPLAAVSSSEIRARAREGRSIEGLVPASVGKYIYENGLYYRP